MRAVTNLSASLNEAGFWPVAQKSPLVAVLAGVGSSEIVNAALADKALTEGTLLRFEPACSPPCDALLWRLETAGGEGLDHPAALGRYWHRCPYAMTLRLVQYQPGTIAPQILDEGTLGTRGSYLSFKAAVERLAMRFVRDAVLGRARGPADALPAPGAYGLPGWLQAFRETWRDRLKTEWWSLGTAATPLHDVLAGAGLGDIIWFTPEPTDRYLADPFPWPGTDRILCEEMPLSGGVGRIVSIPSNDVNVASPTVILDDGFHHSYPCTFRDGEIVYCVAEATQRGATWINRLDNDGRLIPICQVAPNARLADPTLFRWNGRYWLGCTDLDLGGHDNLCLLHASELTGPWKPHSRWPVKIDVRGARCAGMLFAADGRLFRPGQDCAATYGAAVAIHEIVELTETDFREILISGTATGPDRTISPRPAHPGS